MTVNPDRMTKETHYMFPLMQAHDYKRDFANRSLPTILRHTKGSVRSVMLGLLLLAEPDDARRLWVNFTKEEIAFFCGLTIRTTENALAELTKLGLLGEAEPMAKGSRRMVTA
jgi:CRP-like cAMP-binding protein